MNKVSISMLCVSDNSSSKTPLFARGKKATEVFHNEIIYKMPKIVEIICKH